MVLNLISLLRDVGSTQASSGKKWMRGFIRALISKKEEKKRSDYRFAFHCISSIVLNNGCTKLEPSTCICFTSSSSIRTCCELLGHNWINLIEHFFLESYHINIYERETCLLASINKGAPWRSSCRRTFSVWLSIKRVILFHRNRQG